MENLKKSIVKIIKNIRKKIIVFGKRLLETFKIFWETTPKKRLVVYGVLLLLCIPTLYGFVTFSRYIIKNVYDNFLISREFYFYSNVLTDELTIPTYTLYDWDGEDNYTLRANVMNYLDELRWTKESITYEANVSCNPSNGSSNLISCTASNGTINYSSTGGTSVIVNMTIVNNGITFEDDDYVDVELTYTSTSPYRKVLRANFRIYVVVQDVKWHVDDVENRKYFDLYISNYGDIEKNNIEIEWNPSNMSIDTTNTYVINGTTYTTTINGIQYVNRCKISLGSRKSGIIRFYKNDKTQNYTYPQVGVESPLIITH